MTPFVVLAGPAAPLLEENIDTDIIYPARFLLITARDGLGRYAFHDRRYDAADAERAEFVLNRPEYRGAPILLAGANFGCGSSREQAVWALLGAGIACVIAPSFGEIFHGNALRNGMLPVVLPEATIAGLGAQVAVDLPAQTVASDDETWHFDIAAEAKQALLNGWDETALILNTSAADIAAFEARQRAAQPWLWEQA